VSSMPELAQALDRLKAQGRIPDQAHVPALGHYLTERGRAVADGLDLGQVEDHELAELGRLDVLATTPDVDQDLAPRLTMVGDQYHQSLAQHQHTLDHELDQDHNHARLRETGVPPDQDHDRVQLLGLDPGHGTAPEALPQIAPERTPILEPRGLDLGRTGHGARGQWETQVRDEDLDRNEEKGRRSGGRVDGRPRMPREGDPALPPDPVRHYLETVPDEPDEDWSPT
jgi:hypothetical protein